MIPRASIKSRPSPCWLWIDVWSIRFVQVLENLPNSSCIFKTIQVVYVQVSYTFSMIGMSIFKSLMDQPKINSMSIQISSFIKPWFKRKIFITINWVIFRDLISFISSNVFRILYFKILKWRSFRFCWAISLRERSIAS